MKKLIKVKKQIGAVSKNAKNPFFKSAYMDLNQLLEAVEPLLLDNGLLLTQPIEDGKVVSRILDVETNEKIESSIDLLSFNDAQKMGSCITYFRRYTLKSLLAIAEADEDGNNLKAKPKAKKENIDKAIEMGVDLKGIKAKYQVSKEIETYFNTKIK